MDERTHPADRTDVSRSTVLKELLRQRRWQAYKRFRREYDRVAAGLDKELVGTYPSDRTYRRWLSGRVVGIPLSEPCTVLEAMFPGYTIEQLFEPRGAGRPDASGEAGADRLAKAHESSAVPAHNSFSSIGRGSSEELKPASYFTSALRTLNDNDYLFGPVDVIPKAERLIAEIGHAWASTQGRDRAELIHLRARFAELLAWLHQDLGDHAAAQRWADRAFDWSYIGGDREVTAIVLTRKTQLACDMGDPDTATGFGRAATSAAPHVKFAAAATTYAAHGHALAGDRSAAERGYDNARELVARSDGACEWGDWLNHSYIDVHRAQSLNELGDHRGAADIFDNALRALPGEFRRDRGVYLARAARAYAGAREFDHAATLGVQALTIANETRSGRTAAELRRLRDELATTNTGTVREFRDLMRAASTHTPGKE